MDETERTPFTLWLPTAVHAFLTRPDVIAAHGDLQEMFLDATRAFLDDIRASNKVIHRDVTALWRIVDDALTAMDAQAAPSPEATEDVPVCFNIPKALLGFVTYYSAFAKNDRDAYLRDALITGVQADAMAIEGPDLSYDELLKKYGLGKIFK
jgi:hypothetical protein